MTNNIPIYDVAIIGGGVNGLGIAVDAAGRGLSVFLCEQNDFGAHTSSASSKLIHGGLRYLAQGQLRLVYEALHERALLLRKAPHLIHPLRFCIPIPPYRSSWLIRVGLWFYDQLAGRNLPHSNYQSIANTAWEEVFLPQFRHLSQYYDAWVDDARLVISQAIEAQSLGAILAPRTRCIATTRHAAHWELHLQSNANAPFSIKARCLINAAGPWVKEVLEKIMHVPSKHQLSLVRGSHIVVPRFYPSDDACLLFNTDKRVIFISSLTETHQVIGTTEIWHTENPSYAAISDEEINYLLNVVSQYFRHPPTREAICWTYSGVRPLQADQHHNPSTITRDYTFEWHTDTQLAPALSLFGGKITTYRRAAERIVDTLRIIFPHLKSAWTANKPLPGGDLNMAWKDFQQHVIACFPWLPISLAKRYARQYGTRCFLLLKDCCSIEDLGEHFGHGLYQLEITYLKKNEWALTLEDILWRRTKLGLEFSSAEIMLLKEQLHRKGFLICDI